jgi:hypothetical protein
MRHRLLFALALALVAPSVAAQGGRESRKDIARTLGDEGVGLYRAGRYREALELFRRAEELHHAPTLVIYMARCEDKLGKLVAAKRRYVDLLYEAQELPANAPTQFARAVEDAKKELGALEPRIPKLTVVVRGDRAPGATVTIDGTPATELVDVLVDPGDHVVEVRASGAPAVSERVTLAEGASATVELEPGAAAGEPVTEPGGGSTLLWSGVAATAVGGALLVVGAATGAAHLAEVSDLETRCIDGHCPVSDAEEADRAKALADASTATFVIGGVAAAAGVVLLTIHFVDQPEASVGTRLSPTGLALFGAF